MQLLQRYEFKEEIVELLSCAYKSAVYTVKLHLLDHLMQNVLEFEDITVLHAFTYDSIMFISRGHTKRSFREYAICMLETVMLMEQQQTGDRHIMYTKVRCSSQSVVNRNSSHRMEEDGGLV